MFRTAFRAPIPACYSISMSIFISHSSALELLRCHEADELGTLSRAKPTVSVPTRKDVEALDAQTLGMSFPPIHLAVDSPEARGCSKLVACHVWHGPPQARSFSRVSEGIYVSTPEACFLQLAAVVPLPELVLVGLELCGTYALVPGSERGFRGRQKPLTSVASLERTVARAEGLRGAKRARQVLRFLADGSASPMESIVAALLCLPSAFGGYGLAFPHLNYEVAMPDKVRTATGRRRCVCDLYWPAWRLAVEYESDLHHTGGERIASDSKRRTALELANVSVVTITHGQVYDARAFDEAARALAKLMGKRLRISQTGWLMRRYDLRSLVLDPAFVPGVPR